MAEKAKRASAENITKGNVDTHEEGLHPLKGTVKKDNYRDNDSSKHRLKGEDKDKLKKQVHSATENSNNRIADNIQNSENKEQ